MILKLKRTPGIYLVGFMGCGKSTVGRALADELGWNFADLDKDIERRAQAAIADIFDQQGEAAFRALETALLHERVRSVQSGRPHVISLGGGAFLSQKRTSIWYRQQRESPCWLGLSFRHDRAPRLGTDSPSACSRPGSAARAL